MKNGMLSIFSSILIGVTPTYIFAQEPEPPSLKDQLENEKNVNANLASANSNSKSADALSAGGDKDDEKDKGLDDVYGNIQTGLKQVYESYKSISTFPGVTVDAPGYETIISSGHKYVDNRDNCISRQGKAATACLEHLSENLQSGIASVNMLLSTVGSAAVTDTCSTFSKAMDVAKGAMTAYTAACGVMKAGCGWSCVQTRSGLEGLGKGLKASSAGTSCKVNLPPTSPAYVSAESACSNFISNYRAGLATLDANVPKDLNAKDKKAIAGKAALCTGKYALLLASGATGILSLANSLKQGKECKDNTDGTGTTVAEANVDKCTDPANAQLPECICAANPRTPGCANSYQKTNEGGDSRLTSSGGDINPAAISGKDGPGGLGLGSDGSALGENSAGGGSDSGSMAGAPMGGGSGLSGFGGGSGGAGGKEEAAKKGLNTDILSGSGGGGGGGGFGGYRGAASDSKYRAYLPGGAKDPAQGMAGQQAWTKEVTGQGGKSNWDKIKERYRDNKNTLLNN
ncbi:hypothetical protein EZJ49_06345 [Bdellovibrio bacteriovorus]|uniref:hypothetical protein n=1 Tax=Bdellovibrio bacteriovorus TaxID=959 RepID=UPI0021D3A0F4|nr:hypothetical protein [Bdellovibrio bacteriovorus]UXR65867.1 hypothetical protein EZJ49_06345 [Bdellovibrio bacteriovorus]